MRISVIIPFRGNLETLQWVLDGFLNQDLAPGDSLDVRIGSDGVPLVTPPTSTAANISFTALAYDRVGISEAKNRLLERADGDILLFANGDTRPRPDFVRQHAASLASLPPKSMVLGASPYVTRGAQTPETVFDILKRDTPMIFFYPNMQPHHWYDFRHAWNMNVSVRRADVAAAGNFQPRIRPVFYDDIEMAFRVMGLEKRVFFEPAAVVEHCHPMTFDDYLRREELLGLMAPILFDVNPPMAAALFGTANPAALAADFAAWVKMDAPMHAWILRRMNDWIDLPSSSLGDGDSRTRLLATLYQLHIPLKRLAFRLGFLRGMTLRDDALWPQRQPQALWKQILPA